MQQLVIPKSAYLRILLVTALALTGLMGCKAPNAANIQLRKQTQELRAKVDDLERRHAADAAQMRAIEARSGSTLPTLTQEQLDKLFTVQGIQLGRLTGVDDQGVLKVYATPTDDIGQPLKAAGSFVVEAFDLAKKDKPLVDRWEFGLDQARQNWFGQALLYEYVLSCPLPSPPEHPDLTLKVSFTDALTGRTFEAQKVIRFTR